MPIHTMATLLVNGSLMENTGRVHSWKMEHHRREQRGALLYDC